MEMGNSMERIGVEFVAGLQPNEIVECVKYAEELGYESAWMAEGHSGDQFSILTACALQTERILLGTGISVVFVRSAPTVAMAAACVDQFSGGRFILGLASGHREMVEGEHGIRYHRPIQHVREYVQIVRGLLRDGEIRYSGEQIKIENFDLWFKPLRKSIPVYLGAVNPRMLEVCGEIADGVMLTHITVEKAREAVEQIETGARLAGRQPEEVDISAMWGCCVADDRDEARERYRDYLALYPIRLARYRRIMVEAGFEREVEAIKLANEEGDINLARSLVPDELIDLIGLVGTPDDITRRIQEYREAGVGLPIVAPLVDGPMAMEQVKWMMRACVSSP